MGVIPARRAYALIVLMGFLASLLVLAAPPAAANHPSNTCLDLGPETASAPSGTSQVFTATLRANGGTTCEEGAATNVPPGSNAVRIHFEFAGPGDTDGGNTPDTPDAECQISVGSSSCTTARASVNQGNLTVRGWIDHDGGSPTPPTGEQPGLTEADLAEGQDASTNPGTGCLVLSETAEPDCTDVAQVTWGAATLDCAPETATAAPGTAHKITCTARDAAGATVAGANVDAEVTGANDPDGNSPTTPDLTCTTAADGACELTHGPTGTTSTGTSTYRAWLDADGNDANAEADTGERRDEAVTPGAGCSAPFAPSGEPDCTDVVEATWQARAATGLDAEPETATATTNSPHTITGYVYDQYGVLFEGNTQVKFEFFQGSVSDTGNGNSSVPDLTCTTANSSSCTVTVNSGFEGTDRLCVWVGANDVVMSGDTTNGTCSGEGLTDADDAAGTADAPEPASDRVDVVEIRWSATASRLDCSPETSSRTSGTPHEIACTATNSAGAGVGGVKIDVEFTGAGDPDNANGGTPDGGCTTAPDDPLTPLDDEAGTCSFEHTSNAAGTTTYRAWIDDDGNDDNTNEADATEGQDETTSPGSRAEPDDTDVVTNVWIASKLDCAPDTDADGANVGTSHTITCTARDAGNTVRSGVVVDWELTGANDPDDANAGPPDHTCTTGVSGTCSFTHTGTTEAGKTTYRAWIDADGNNDNVNEGDTAEPVTPDDEDSTDVMEQDWKPLAPNTLDCDDSSGDDRETNPSGQGNASIESYTCVVKDINGNGVPNIDVKGENENGVNDPDATDGTSYASPDYTCRTDAEGDCALTVSQGEGESGTAEICFWVGTTTQGTTFCSDEPTDEAEANDLADQVELTWSATGLLILDCSPEVSRGQAAVAHTVTCSATSPTGTPASGALVDVEASGANDPDAGFTPNSPDFGCTTGPTGSCSFIHGTGGTGTTNGAGTTTYRAWIDADGNNNTVEADQIEARDETATPGTGCLSLSGTPEPDCTDVVEKTWTATDIDCAPETATTPAGEQHSVTCIARDAAGATVAGEVIDLEIAGEGDTDGNTPDTPDRTCTTDPDGRCSFTHTSDGAGTSEYRAWLDTDTNHPPTGQTEADRTETQPAEDGDNTDVTSNTWTASRLDCGPEEANNPTGSSHTISCTASDEEGGGVAGVKIDAEFSGANDPDNGAAGNPDATCTTDAEGTCDIVHAGDTSDTGETVYRAWIDSDGNDNNLDEADQEEGVDEGAEAGDTAEPDRTDVVRKNWQGPGLDCNPEDSNSTTGTTHTVTCTLRDSNLDPVEGANIDVEITGANDPDNTNGGSPDRTCTTDAEGQCSITHGPGASTGTTTYRAWHDTDNNDTTDESDSSETMAHEDQDGTDVVQHSWTAGRLDCTPETGSKSAGVSHDITCTATAADNSPIAGVAIDIEASGANDTDGGPSNQTPDFTCTTGANGSCTVTHSGTNSAGSTSYRAWIDADNNDANVEADQGEGRNEAQAPGSRAEPDNTDVVEVAWTATRLDCSPESATVATGGSHRLTCTASDAAGSPVNGVSIDVEVTGANDPDGNATLTNPDMSCTTTSNGSCAVTHGPDGPGTTDQAGTTTYRAWIDADSSNSTPEADSAETASPDDTDNTDVTSATWQQPALDCSPDQDSNPAGTAHTITCSVPSGLSGAQIDVEASGANDPDGNTSRTSPDFSCTTTGGSCSFIHGPGGKGTTTQLGTTTYRAWVDTDGSDATSEADANETTSPDDTDSTDVMEKNWTGEPATVEMTPEADSASVGSCNAFTITVKDSAGQPLQGVLVDVEQVHSTAETQPSGDEPDVGFCVPSAADGPNPSDVNVSAGDLRPPAESPDNVGTEGGETTTGTDSQGRVTIGIAVTSANGSNGQGTVRVTAFVERVDDDDPGSGEPSDSSVKTWVAPEARRIDCAPDTAITSTGATHTVTCSVTDRFGQPVQGEGVTFTESGPGELTSATTASSDSQGRVSVTAASESPGTQQITGTLSDDLEGAEPAEVDDCDRPAADPVGSVDGRCSETVQNTWTAQPACSDGADNDGDGKIDHPDDAGCESPQDDDETDPERFCPGYESDPRNQIVGTEDGDVLTGTEGDDIICGLGGDDQIQGLGGSDVILGGGGADLVSGGEGADRIQGGGGADTLAGDGGRDVISGGGGNDRLSGGGGNDHVVGDGGNDRISGNGGDDVLAGGRGSDNLSGGKGDDRLNGGPGRDRGRGGPGRDRIRNCES